MNSEEALILLNQQLDEVKILMQEQLLYINQLHALLFWFITVGAAGIIGYYLYRMFVKFF